MSQLDVMLDSIAMRLVLLWWRDELKHLLLKKVDSGHERSRHLSCAPDDTRDRA